MATEKPDPTAGWSVDEFGAPGGQLSKSVSELDDAFPDVPQTDDEPADDSADGSDS